MKKPKFIIVFIDCLDEAELLSDEQAGRLIKALLRYAIDGTAPDFADDIAIRMLFSILQKQVDRDFEKYERLCRKRSEAGRGAALR